MSRISQRKDTPIKPSDFIDTVYAACPGLQDYIIDTYGREERQLPYVFCGYFAGFLCDKYKKQQTSDFPAYAALIERLLTEEDDEVKNLAVVGIIEGIIRIWSYEDFGPQAIRPYLLPQSKQRFDDLLIGLRSNSEPRQ